MIFERGPGFKGSIAACLCETTASRIALGAAAFLFAATGPLVIILTTANGGGLPFETTVSWIFIIYFSAGAGTIVLSLYYREPIIFAFSLPGVVIVGDALKQYPYTDVLGTYFVIAVILFGLGISGVVGRILKWIPVPVLMGMVVAVLLPYGRATFTALVDIPAIALPTLAVFLFLAGFPRLGRVVPPVLGAIVVALICSTVTGATDWGALQPKITTPQFFIPTFNFNLMIELVLPLSIAALAMQNGQGFAVLLGQGYKPPVNTMSTATGILSVVNLLFGGNTSCVSGFSMAIAASPESGPKEGRFAAAIANGVFWVLFSIVAPVAVSIDRVILKKSLIPMLGGLATLSVLLSSIQAAFTGAFRNGALFACLITLSDIKVLGIGSAFWGLAGGLLAALILDRGDFKEMAARIRREAASSR